MYWDRATLKICGTDIDPSQGEEHLVVTFDVVDNSEIEALLEDTLSDSTYSTAPPPYHLDRRSR